MMQTLVRRGFHGEKAVFVRSPQREGREEFITKKDVAVRLLKTERTVEKWQRLGYIPFVKVGNSVLYKWSQIEMRLEKCFALGVWPPEVGRPSAAAGKPSGPPSPKRLRRTGRP